MREVHTYLRGIDAELREMRKEAFACRVEREELDSVREQLETLRGSGRRRSAEWRARNVTQRHRNVTAGSLKALALDLKAKEQEQDQKQEQQIPASRHRDVSNVTRPTRDAYSAAYERRHGAKPIWNATTNAQMSRFVKRVGVEEAPAIAEFYVGHKSAWYVQQLHPVSLLLKDAEKLHTEWITGKQSTATEARQQERTQANADGWAQHLKGGRNGVV